MSHRKSGRKSILEPLNACYFSCKQSMVVIEGLETTSEALLELDQLHFRWA